MVSPAGIEAYSFSTPFGYILPAVESISKAFRFLRNHIYKDQHKAGLCIYWCLQQESNPHRSLRTGLLYPLSYGDKRYNTITSKLTVSVQVVTIFS